MVADGQGSGCSLNGGGLRARWWRDALREAFYGLLMQITLVGFASRIAALVTSGVSTNGRLSRSVVMPFLNACGQS
ncbi:hypothetical protein [Glutamicibacter uratoxydans]|uniref:hypothetical protein n=1 Tax=Glutamicibacter uratoxydans TaxID=43667 RepID=UPI003D6FE316